MHETNDRVRTLARTLCSHEVLHVDNTDDVIDLVHARINASIDLAPLAADDPIDGLRRFAHSYRRAYAAHRVAATVIISRSLNAHHALAVYEAAASCLLRAGVPSGQVMPLLAFLDAIALGSAIEPFAAGFTGSIGDYRREYPAIAESLSHSRRRRIDDEGFEVGLRSFLAAVALHAASTDRA